MKRKNCARPFIVGGFTTKESIMYLLGAICLIAILVLISLVGGKRLGLVLAVICVDIGIWALLLFVAVQVIKFAWSVVLW